MQIVPLKATANQTLLAPVSSQNCRVNVYQKNTGMFMDVLVDEEPIILGVLCENLNRIVRNSYLGFVGDFMFLDTQGSDDPVYTGLGDRWQLVYLEAAELPAGD